jgi:hypothetical protein
LRSRKRKHDLSSPRTSGPLDIAHAIVGHADSLPNDPDKPTTRTRSYVIIDCSSQSLLENSVSSKVTLDRIKGKDLVLTWTEIIKRIDTCRARNPSESVRYPNPLCLVLSCRSAQCNWTYGTYEANETCGCCLGRGDPKTWKILHENEQPQCLKTPTDRPHELWLLNPTPEDMVKQHQKDLQDRHVQEPAPSPTTSIKARHTRASSNNGRSFVSKASDLLPSSLADQAYQVYEVNCGAARRSQPCVEFNSRWKEG